MSSLIPPVSAARRPWYNTEKNTAALVQSIVKSRSVRTLSGDDIWSLIRLTWISMGTKDVSPTHWKRLKVPALESLFKKTATPGPNLSVTVDSMNLPSPVAQLAKQDTGMVNFRPTWRNSSRKWCQQNRDNLRSIISTASETSGKRPSANHSGGAHRQIAACRLAQSQSESCGWCSAHAPNCMPRSEESIPDPQRT